MAVLTYQCPQCGAPLTFHEESQHWDCQFCLGSFELEDLEKIEADKGIDHSGEDAHMREYVCPQCGAQIVTEETTAAAFCVFCQNATIFPEKLKGAFRPERIIPFQVTKEAAQAAFKRHCAHKPLLPRDFYAPDRIEKITGVYVPFWLFSCAADANFSGRAQRVSTWSDSKYRYTKTDFYQIIREGRLAFRGVPADGSSKMDDALMDSIGPFDQSKMVEYSPAYLSGFLAERYDVDSAGTFPRVHDQMRQSARNYLMNTVQGFSGVSVDQESFRLSGKIEQNVLFPVWMLTSQYKGKTYLFAMNGQTGKLIGDLPLSAGRVAAWALAIFAALFLLLLLGGMLL